MFESNRNRASLDAFCSYFLAHLSLVCNCYVLLQQNIVKMVEALKSSSDFLQNNLRTVKILSIFPQMKPSNLVQPLCSQTEPGIVMLDLGQMVGRCPDVASSISCSSSAHIYN